MPYLDRHRDNLSNFSTALAYEELVHFRATNYTGWVGENEGWAHTFWFNNPYGYTMEFDQMSDSINHKDRKTKRYPPTPCYHKKVRIDSPPQMPDYNWRNDSLGWNGPIVFIPNAKGNRPLMGIPHWCIDAALGNLVVSGIQLWHDVALTNSEADNLNLEAFNYFGSVFPEELSAGEFAQNFTELGSLLPRIKDSILSTLASGYLTKEFGWDNLLSDLNTLNSLLDHIKSRMAYLKATYGKPQRLGFARHDVHSLPYGLEHYAWSDTLNWNGLGGSVKLTSATVSFHATCWILQELDHLSDAIGWVRAVATSFGLDNPVLAFWKTIPFSFVVDWFLNVSGHLKRWLTAKPAVGWTVYDFTTSVTTRLSFLLETYVENRPNGNETVASTNMDCEVYERFVGLSVNRDLLNLSDLSLHQLILLASLGLS